MKSSEGFEEYIRGVKKKHGIPDDVELRSVSQVPEVAQKISESQLRMPKEKKDAK